MRHFQEVLRYAREAPPTEPVPITDSEIPQLSEWIQNSDRKGDLILGESIRLAVYSGRVKILGHPVIVL